MLKQIFSLVTFLCLFVSTATASESLSIMIDPDGFINSLLLYDDDYYSYFQREFQEAEKNKVDSLSERIAKEGQKLIQHIQNLISSNGFKVLTFDGQGYGIHPFRDEGSEAISTGVGIGEFGILSQINSSEADFFLHILFNRAIKKWEILLYHPDTTKYIYEEIDLGKLDFKELKETISDIVLSILAYAPKLAEVKADRMLDAIASKVAYELETKSGEIIQIICDYMRDMPNPTIKNIWIGLTQPKANGTYTFLVPAQEEISSGSHNMIIFELVYEGNKLKKTSIQASRPINSAKISGPVTLTVKSKGGYTLTFIFTEDRGKLKLDRIDPPNISPWDITDIKRDYKGIGHFGTRH